MASFLQIIWILLQIVIGYNLLLPFALYVLYLLFASKKTTTTSDISEPDYAVIVTAYEQTDTLPSVVSSLLKMDFNNYIIYIVADKCDISNLDFKSEKVVLLKPEQTLASNTRSHFYAINHFKRNHQYLTIIDSDNLAEPDYLKKLTVYFNKGFLAVQGIRNAKNLDTTYASLDAARDIYYHFYDGKLLFKLGSSATLAGSGMAFTVQLYKECLGHLDVTGAGFDKVLQAAILQKNYRIAFAEDAIVYDEKTSRSDQLVKQRARWINTWFKYVKLGMHIFLKGIINFNRNQFLFGLILLRPPLFIFLLLSVVCMIIDIFIQPFVAIILVIAFLFFVISFFIALMSSNTDKRIYRSLINIPKFIFFQVLSLLKVRKANKYSIATQHYHDKSLDEVNTK